MKPGVLVLMWLLLVTACDPCEECGEPLVYDPLVTLVFINQDSAEQLRAEIKFNLDSADTLRAIRTDFALRADTLSDSLEVVIDSIEAGGTGLEDLRIVLEDSIEQLETHIDSLNAWASRVVQPNTELNQILSTINSGNLLVERITVLQSGAELTFEDSARQFRAPLLMTGSETVPNRGETDLQIEIAGTNETHTLFVNFTYELTDELSSTRVFRRIAKNIEATSLDSLTQSCQTDNCLSNETTVTLYF